ncbi:Small nuclear ribonucleoprotein family protein [Carpediemonas membranifera]|uniref:Small nuclear ribonucleoprotein family protein n=1 Tax=Carpediemonas membranifera TaxID=201153 RepID=A0A8J6DXW7_9EUKA|nr:Small nuclear ribonucleoprotein family protein [Carpediemonas membranifera]|eukprot:KAG9391119.1 Small nuclear ribonucleoprotein family protein [Carpediemonas membranifera]
MSELTRITKPLDLIRLSLDQEIYVRLIEGRELKGKLHGFDQHPNLIMEDVDETITKVEIDPDTLEETSVKTHKSHEMLFVRAENIIRISPMLQKRIAL